MSDTGVAQKEVEDREYWIHYRAALMDQLNAVETHRLHMRFTTADLRFWFGQRAGISEETAARQVAHIKSCKKDT